MSGITCRALASLAALFASLTIGGCGEPRADGVRAQKAAAAPAAAPAPDVTRTLAAREATRRGLHETQEVRERLEQIRADAAKREEEILRDALFQNLVESIQPSEEALRDHYEKTKVRYTQRRVRLRRYPMESAQAAAAALETGSLAREPEIIGPAPVAELPQAVLPEATRLGNVGGRLVAGNASEGWSVIELVEVLPAAQRSFEEVRSEVEAAVRLREADREFRELLLSLKGSPDGRPR
jgi:hypothetical protein